MVTKIDLFDEEDVMLIEQEVNRLLSELSQADRAQIHLNGYAVSVNMMDKGSKLGLTTPVYLGGNYIPKSVRGSLNRKVPFDRLAFPTTLVVDEEAFSISLKYVGDLSPSGYQGIVDLLEDFSWLADKWRDYLDEQDKNDLVYVPVK
jgi:hypothetical protein